MLLSILPPFLLIIAFSLVSYVMTGDLLGSIFMSLVGIGLLTAIFI